MGEDDRDLIGVQVLPHFAKQKTHVAGESQRLSGAPAVAVVEAGEGKKPAVLRRHALRKRLQHAGRQDHTVQSQVLQLLWVSKPCRKPLLDVLDHRPRFRRLKGAADVGGALFRTLVRPGADLRYRAEKALIVAGVIGEYLSADGKDFAAVKHCIAFFLV